MVFVSASRISKPHSPLLEGPVPSKASARAANFFAAALVWRVFLLFAGARVPPAGRFRGLPDCCAEEPGAAIPARIAKASATAGHRSIVFLARISKFLSR